MLLACNAGGKLAILETGGEVIVWEVKYTFPPEVKKITG